MTLPANESRTFSIERPSDEEINPDSLSSSILGNIVNITPDGSNPCSSINLCIIEFFFDKIDADNAGISPFDVKVHHDKNDDGDFDDEGEVDNSTIIIQINENTFKATTNIDKFSKFAVGGSKALAIGGIVSGNGQSQSIFAPKMGDTSLVMTSNADGGFGGMLQRNNLNTIKDQMIFNPNDELLLSIPIVEDQGVQYIKHVGLYLNNVGTDLRSKDYDTSIVYEKYEPKEVTIIDPHGLFKYADIKIQETGRTEGIIQFNLIFAKDMDTSNLYITIWDMDRNPTFREFKNILKISEQPKEIELSDSESIIEIIPTKEQIPKWVKNNAGWWAEGLIEDEDFVSGMQYLINKEIMTIPQTQSEQSIQQEIPNWIKNNAGWWSRGLIEDEDFVSGMQYLIKTGILKV